MTNTTRSTTALIVKFKQHTTFYLHTKRGRDFLQIESISNSSQEISFSTYAILWEDHQYKSVIEYIKH